MMHRKLITIYTLLAEKNMLNWMPDKTYLRLYYRLYTGKKLNLKNPTRYNEKLQWLKLNYRTPLLTKLVDKYLVREYVAAAIGEEYLIPLLGVWNTPEEIEFDKLPDKFVLKCNHDSGGVIICKDKNRFDIDKACGFLKAQQKVNFYWKGREWPYKNVEKKIIAEQFMVDESGYELKDYKFFCFDGKCRAIFIATDRNVDTRFDFYDSDFNHLPFTNGHPNADREILKPQNFDEMKHLAEVLSKGMPQVRVDLYNINGRIYFGEMTLFHWGGKIPFEPDEWDYKFGSWIDLPEKQVEI